MISTFLNRNKNFNKYKTKKLILIQLIMIDLKMNRKVMIKNYRKIELDNSKF